MHQPEISTFLSGIRVENRAYLPATLIDRKVFEKHIKKHLDNLGGKWSSALKCYEFPFDPTERLADLVSGKKVKLSSKYHYFDTPIDLVGSMFMFAQEAGLDWSTFDVSTTKFLEPGAGRANILKNAFVKGFNNLYYYELMPENRVVIKSELQRLNIPATYLGEDFLKREQTGFDIVVANPPFRHERRHIEEMFEVVRSSGIIITLGSQGLYDEPSFIEFLNRVSDKWEMREIISDPQAPLFEGTLTGCTMIAARKRCKSLPRGLNSMKQLNLF